jgi:phage portal protein BeeE
MVALSFWQHWFDRSFQRKSSSLESLPSFLYAPESKSGIPINWRSALDVTTVLGCCRVLAEGVSQVPLKVYRPRAGGGADPATDHWSYDLLYRKPNPWQTSFEFRETIMFHLALCFNAFIFKNVVGSKIKELIPIEPGRVFVTQNSDMTLAYTVTMPQGQQVKLTQKEIWHIRGPSWNSWMGLDAVKMAREAIGLAAALEATQASFHKNNMQPRTRRASLLFWIGAQNGRRSPPAGKTRRRWNSASIRSKRFAEPPAYFRKWLGITAIHLQPSLVQSSFSPRMSFTA